MSQGFSPAWYRVFLEPIPAEITDAEVAFVERQLPRVEHPELLDVCCGPGRHANRLAGRGYRVLGTDVNEGAIERARRDAAAGAEYEVLDMRRLAQLDRTFDGVLNLWHSFGYFDEPTNREVLRAMHDRLRPGGRLLLDVYNRDHLEGLPADEVATRGGEQIRTRREWDDRRLRVTLCYEREGGRDELEWRIYDPTELRELAKSVGFRARLGCAWFDDSIPPSAEHARMQFVFERPA